MKLTELGLRSCGFFIALAACCLFAGNVWAQSGDKIGWSITPYLWASNTKGDLTFRDTGIGGDKITFNDLLDVLDTAFMAHVEGGKGMWSVFGYQYKQAEFKDGDLSTDFTYYGPMAGFNFRF